MSVRYDMPPEDYDVRRQQESAQDQKWKTLAEEAMRDDPEFQRWKRRHWRLYRTASFIAFFAMLTAIVITHDARYRRVREFSPPFVIAAAIYAWGTWIYTKKVRAIGVRVWSEQRTLELARRQPNKPLHGTPAKAPSSSTAPEGRRP